MKQEDWEKLDEKGKRKKLGDTTGVIKIKIALMSAGIEKKQRNVISFKKIRGFDDIKTFWGEKNNSQYYEWGNRLIDLGYVKDENGVLTSTRKWGIPNDPSLKRIQGKINGIEEEKIIRELISTNKYNYLRLLQKDKVKNAKDTKDVLNLTFSQKMDRTIRSRRKMLKLLKKYNFIGKDIYIKTPPKK